MSWHPVGSFEIHQTWKREDTLTPDMKHSISEWKRLHPHFVHRFWDDDACDAFMRARYPEFYPTYTDLPFGVQKADMFRIAVLHDRGGLYADTDVVPNMTIDESPLWTRGELIFASWERNQTNAFIVAKTPGHPLLLKALRLMVDRHWRCREWGLYTPVFYWLTNPLILYTTGPDAIRSSVGRPADVYYIPQFEWMPCAICVEYTEKCPENSGRYFSHLNGKVWNSALDLWMKTMYCRLSNRWIWIWIAIFWFVYRYLMSY
jgi:mannosyltransferase OCH1-like enzyme